MWDFIIFTFVILMITSWLQMQPFYWRRAKIPYSVPWPIIGSMALTFVTPFRTLFNLFYANMGDSPAYGFHFFGDKGLLLRDPKLIKLVGITEADSFMKRGFHKEEDYDPMSKGLFFSDGEQWKVFRSKMTPSFTPSRIKAMMPLIKPTTHDFIDYIKKDGARGPVDVNEASMKFAVDVVTTTIFGLQPDSFVNPDSFFFNLQKEIVSFIFGIKSLIGNLNPFLYRTLRLSFLMHKTNEKMTGFVHDVINQRLRGVGNRPDFVQSMVDLMKKEEETMDHENKLNSDGTIPARFDRFGITGQCMLMYLAGTETTGNTISFLLYELALNQHVQDKARREIVDLIEKTKDQYSVDDLQNLHYVNMVVKETLRKYPVLVLYTRRCTKAIDLNGIPVPKNTIVVIAPICLHHDPKYFPEPDKFLPERFEEESNIQPGTYVPFGVGPRLCIGMRFAQTEIVLAVCKLLPKFKLMPSDKTEIPLKFSFNPTLSPANGIFLNLEPIK